MIQIRSVEEPFRRPEIVGPTLGILKRAGAMGLFTKSLDKLDLHAFREVVRSLHKAGIAKGAEPAGRFLGIETRPTDIDRVELLRFMKVLTDALEDSPAPAFEWERMIWRFQPEQRQLADLLGISLSSLRRYRSKQRDTPDDVAARLHFLALLTGDLAGAYNDAGVRNWFLRKRALLDGKAPKDLLHGEWRPGDSDPERVRALARSLAAGSAT
jgi:hypothetical protein